LLRGVAALALAAPGAAAAVQRPASARPVTAPGAPTGQWRSSVWELYRSVEPADAPALGMAALAERLTRWRAAPGLSAEDIPEDLRRRRFSATTAIAVDIDAAGAATGCRILQASGVAALDRLACERVVAQGGFVPLYAGPGLPIAARWTYVIGWETLQQGRDASAFAAPVPSPPAPPPPSGRPGTWPRFDYAATVFPASLPAIQPLFPSGARRRQGVVSLELVTTAQGGVVDCRVGVGSGDRTLDEAACIAARRLELRYERPGTWWRQEALPLQVVWRRGGGSHIRLPLLHHWRTDLAALPRDPADARTATRMTPPTSLRLPLTDADFAGIEPLYPRSAFASLDVATDRTGRIRSCTVTQRTGVPGVDARLCPIASERLRPAPQLDVFGDAVDAVQSVFVTLSRPR
jgi:TonB family protein